MYKLYARKQLKCGFIVLCPEHNVRHAQCTARSIRARYDSPFIFVTDSTVTKEEVRELENTAPTYVAGTTFSSLINLGFKHPPSDWNILVIAGTTVRPKLDEKFALFVEDEKDILFPVADGRWQFIEGTINGLMMHRETFQKAGDWDDNLPIETCKLLWAYEAARHGCRFKAVIGSKMC